MLTFILFFTFVVNTGMLVNAKINLQNAADLAAYSGAAVQARQLNEISFLNYQMRREYKKFLFRYYVIGNMAQKTHPTTAGGGPRLWSPDGSVNYGVPAVCVNFQSNDNYCQISNLKGTSIPMASPLDATSNALSAALTDIETIRQAGCLSIGKTNLQLLTYWLFNTDPTLSQVGAALSAAQSSTAPPPGDLNPVTVLNTLQSLASGIGLVPRELILRSRIKTLNEYLNHKVDPQGLTIAAIDTMKSAADWPSTERGVQAFLSAYHTLGNNIFDNSNNNIVMTELLPAGLDGSAMLQLTPDTKAEFDTYAIDFELVPNGTGTNSADCVSKLTPITLKGMGVPVAVHKDPSILTYYAIRLEAQAKVMFSPWGDMSLKAYAAAQPFGSRIGPSPSWTSPVTMAGQSAISPCPAGKCVGSIPYLEVENGKGWNNNDVIYSMYEGFAAQSLTGGGPAAIPPTLSVKDMDRAYHVAMVPNPIEVGSYNIPGDPNLQAQDPMVNYFDSTGIYAMWAPIQSVTDQAAAGSAGNAATFITDMIKQSMQTIQVGTSTTAVDSVGPVFLAALSQGLTAYFASLRSGAGEDAGGGPGVPGEGFNVFRMNDPFNTLIADGAPRAITFPNSGQYFMNDPTKVKSSWNAVLDPEIKASGRTGYSVKLVPFKTLFNKGKSYSDGFGATWTNLPGGDSVADADMLLLQH